MYYWAEIIFKWSNVRAILFAEPISIFIPIVFAFNFSRVNENNAIQKRAMNA